MNLNESISKSKNIALLLLLLISSFPLTYLISNNEENDSNQASDNNGQIIDSSYQVSEKGQIDGKKQKFTTSLGVEEPPQTVLRLKINSLESVQKLTTYPTKDPFTITSNSQFTANGFTGSGSSGDPYVLEHWNFYVNYVVVVISISNTNAYFEIRENDFSTNIRSPSFKQFILLTNVSHATIKNNSFMLGNQAIKVTGPHSDLISITSNIFTTVYDGIIVTATSEQIDISNNTFNDMSKNGITLTSVRNVTILNNSINLGKVGINLDGTNSTNIALVNNTITNGQDGIGIFTILGNVTIFNNTITTQTSTGITLIDANGGNSVENNTISNNGDSGIEITRIFSGTYGTTVKNNVLTNNYIFLETGGIATVNYTQNTFSNNFVNNKPVDFFQFVDNPQFSSNPAEIIVLHSTNVSIKDLPTIFGPFIVSGSEDVYISNITIDNSHYTGIDLFWDKNVTVTNNNILNVWGDGIETNAYTTNEATDLILTNNLITSSSICPQLYCDGLVLNKISVNSSIYNNTIINFQYGIHIYYSDNQTIVGNSIINSSSFGIFIDYSNNAIIIDNSIDARNTDAIKISGVTAIKEIHDNRFYNSSLDLLGFAQFNFTNNTYENQPIVILNGIKNQILTPNGTIPSIYGQLFIQNAEFVEIRNLQVLYDIHVYTSTNVSITNTTIRDHGVFFFNSGNLTIQNNQIGSSIDGLHIQTDVNYFNNLVIRNNTILGKQVTSTEGIYLSGMNNVVIENNMVKYFPYGIFLNGDANGQVMNNLLIASDGPSYAGGGTGVYISYAASFNNYFTNNIIKYFYKGIHVNYNVIYINEFYNNTISNGYYGVYMSQSINSSIDNNIFSFNIYGIYFDSAKFNNVTNNIFTNSTNYNLYLTQSSFNIFKGNVFTNTTYHDVEILSTSVNNTFNGNLFTDNNYYMYFDTTSGNNTITDNIFLDTLYVAIQINSANNFIVNNDFIGNNWTNTNFPPGNQIQILNPNNLVLGNYYSNHNNVDFDWNDIADTPYLVLSPTLRDEYPKVRPIFSPDIIAPLVLILPMNNSVFNATGFLLNYNISERSITEIYINGQVNSSSITSGTNMSYLTDGTYNITIVATDLSGNVAITQIFVVIDTIAPVVIFTHPVNATYNALSLNVSYHVIESSNYSIQFYVNGVQNSTNLLNHTFWLFSEGFNNITVYAIDQVGNSALWYVFFSIDVSPPVLTIFTPLNTTYTLYWFAINYTVSDFSIFNTTIYFDGTPNQTVINLNSVIQVTNGYHNVTFMIIDIFNQTTVESVFFTVDILPYVNILSIENKTYPTNELMLNYTLLYTDKVEIYIDDALNQTQLNNGSIITFLGDGSHNITIRALDSLNRSTVQTILFSIDTVLPTLDILSPLNTTYHQISLILEYSTTKGSSLDIIINGVHNVSTTLSGTQITLLEGYHNITLVVTDYLGRSVSESVFFTIKLTSDTTTTPIPTTTTTTPTTTTTQSQSSQTTNDQTSPLSILDIIIAMLIISLYTIVIIRRRKID